MFSFFPIFAWYLQDNTDRSINIGFLREPNDSDFVDGIVIGCSRSEENQEIKDQGYANSHSLILFLSANF
jgi:hypothetical protein